MVQNMDWKPTDGQFIDKLYFSFKTIEVNGDQVCKEYLQKKYLENFK